jgi:hypothetical protein
VSSAKGESTVGALSCWLLLVSQYPLSIAAESEVGTIRCWGPSPDHSRRRSPARSAASRARAGERVLMAGERIGEGTSGHATVSSLTRPRLERASRICASAGDSEEREYVSLLRLAPPNANDLAEPSSAPIRINFPVPLGPKTV